MPQNKCCAQNNMPLVVHLDVLLNEVIPEEVGIQVKVDIRGLSGAFLGSGPVQATGQVSVGWKCGVQGKSCRSYLRWHDLYSTSNLRNAWECGVKSTWNALHQPVPLVLWSITRLNFVIPSIN